MKMDRSFIDNRKVLMSVIAFSNKVIKHNYRAFLNKWKDDMDQIFTGRLFQSVGGLNMKAFLAVDLETAGTETKS